MKLIIKHLPAAHCVLAAGLLCALAPAPSRADAPKVEVAQLSVTNLQDRVAASKDPELQEWFNRKYGDRHGNVAKVDQYGTLPGQGTELTLWVSVPGKTILNVDQAKSRFGSFTDDRGNNLFPLPGGAPNLKDWLDDSRFGIAGGGTLCVFTIGAPGVPVKGATKVLLNATLVLHCGGPLKTFQQANVAVKNGSAITTGPAPITISKVRPRAEGEPEGLDLTLTAHRPEALTEVAFYDAAGKEIESALTGTHVSGSLSARDYQEVNDYFLERRVPVVTVKVTYHTNLEDVTVPIRIASGLGLAK